MIAKSLMNLSMGSPFTCRAGPKFGPKLNRTRHDWMDSIGLKHLEKAGNCCANRTGHYWLELPSQNYKTATLPTWLVPIPGLGRTISTPG